MDAQNDFELGEITTQIESSPLATKGLRTNAKKNFTITLSGREFYSLLYLLQEFAVSESDYVRVRALVLWVEKIGHQLRAQGF